MKFGKQIQRRQLDLPEYAASFFNYKALKKVPNIPLHPHQCMYSAVVDGGCDY